MVLGFRSVTIQLRSLFRISNGERTKHKDSKTMKGSPDVPSLALNERKAALRNSVLFLAVCSPLIFAPRYFSVPHPVIPLALLLIVTATFLRWDGRSAAVLGLNPSSRSVGHFAAGFGGGTLLIITAASIARFVLPFPWQWNPQFDPTAAATWLLYLFFSNFAEELTFRGYGFERLIAGIGHWPAQIATAMLFAVFHVLNGWPWQVAIVGTTVGSLLFGLVFVRWRSVPAAAGVHIAVNWTREMLFSDPPTLRTLFGPLSPRPWTFTEQLLSIAIILGLSLVACVMVAISMRTLKCNRPSSSATGSK